MKLKLTMLALMAVATPLAIAQAAPADVAAAVAAKDRVAEHIALDEVRKPVEVLRFMGLEKGDRVLDYFTGSGYYAEIMARAVGPKGMVVGWNTPSFMSSERVKAATAKIRQASPNVSFYATPTTALSFPPESYDFVMMHLVYHDAYWESARFNLPRIDPNSVVQAVWNATKPGGIVAVVDHVGTNRSDPRAEVEAVHRIHPEIIREDFQRAGFILEAESDMLRNPADDPKVSVFDPKIRGRTDRIVYRFRKPTAAR
jgi:predicted methyltransferase